MAYIGGSHCPSIVSVTGVVTAQEGRAQFAVLRVDCRNVGVLARAWLMEGCGALWARGGEFGCWAMEVWYQWGERSVGCQTSAGGGGDMAVLSRALLRGQEGGMLGREAGGTVGGNRQVRMLVVVTRVKGFT